VYEVQAPNHRRNPIWLLLAVLATLGLVAGACGSSKSSTTSATTPAQAAQASDGNLPADEGTPKDGGKMVWGLEAETDSMSPSVGRWALSGHMVASAVFDPLVTIDDNGKAVPYLAESITPNAADTEWLVKLHSGISFHDGEPLDAAAVVKNLQADKASIITSKAMPWVDTISVADPLTVKITTTQPWATLPNLFASQVGYIAAPRQIDDFHGGDYPIGTGPFVFKEWVKNDHFTATKNPNYWQKGLPHLDEIEYRAVPDAQQRLDQLNDGTLDAMNTVTPKSIDQIRANSNLLRLEYNKGESSFVVLNSSVPPFDNANARKAVVLATNSADYINQLGPGVYQPSNGVYAEGKLGYLADSGYPGYDLAAATDAVKAYTAETGKPLSFTYVGASNVDDARAQQLLKSMWEQAGMKVDLQAVPQADQVITVVLGKYQAADFRLFNQPDPDQDWVWLSSSAIGKNGDLSLNFARYTTPAMDAALNDGRTTTDDSRRKTDYETVNSEVNAGLPFVWLARVDWTIASSNRVHGYAPARNGSLQSLGPKTWVANLWLG